MPKPIKAATVARFCLKVLDTQAEFRRCMNDPGQRAKLLRQSKGMEFGLRKDAARLIEENQPAGRPTGDAVARLSCLAPADFGRAIIRLLDKQQEFFQATRNGRGDRFNILRQCKEWEEDLRAKAKRVIDENPRDKPAPGLFDEPPPARDASEDYDWQAAEPNEGFTMEPEDF